MLRGESEASLKAAGKDLSSVMVRSKFAALIHLGLARRFGMLKK